MSAGGFNVSETVKIHIILTHVEEFIRKEGRPLGEFSEQELENSHSAWLVVWSRYKVKDMSSDIYLQRLPKAVDNFNSNNI